MKIILGVTGSVAGILTPKLVGALIDANHEVQIVSTTPGLYFLPEGIDKELEVKTKKGPVKVPLFRDKDEWPVGGYHKKDPVQHIEFRTWADLLLIAPLSANTLAKISHGLCDNFLCCIARAWPKQKPLVVAPAMNTEMWNDPITEKSLELLKGHFQHFNPKTTSSRHRNAKTWIRRYKDLTVVEPIEATLACGDTGIGAMARIETIVETVNSFK